MKKEQALSLFDRAILSRAAVDAVAKLHPKRMISNPVMFIVEVGALATTLFLLPGLSPKGLFGFQLQIVLWLWATVLFANFAEAVAEGRGKAQADALRRAKTDAVARRLLGEGSSAREERVPASTLRKSDRVVVEEADGNPAGGAFGQHIASQLLAGIAGSHDQGRATLQRARSVQTQIESLPKTETADEAQGEEIVDDQDRARETGQEEMALTSQDEEH